MTLLWEVCSLGVTGNVANANNIQCSLTENNIGKGIASFNFTTTCNLIC